MTIIPIAFLYWEATAAQYLISVFEEGDIKAGVDTPLNVHNSLVHELNLIQFKSAFGIVDEIMSIYKH